MLLMETNIKPSTTHRFSRLWAGAVVLASFALAATPAHAVIINALGGNYSSANTSGGPSNLQLVGGVTVTPDVGGSLLANAKTDNLLIALAGYNGVVNGAAGPVTIPSLSITDGATKAVFDVSNAKLSQQLLALPTGSFGLGFVVADVKLNTTLTTPAALQTELAKFIPGGTLVLTYNSILVTSAGGGTATVSLGASASMTLTAIPEAASLTMATSGLACFVGMVWWWRRGRTLQVVPATVPAVQCGR